MKDGFQMELHDNGLSLISSIIIFLDIYLMFVQN